MDGDPASYHDPSLTETTDEPRCSVEAGTNCPHDGTPVTFISNDVAVVQSLTPDHPSDNSDDMKDDREESTSSELSDMKGFEAVTSRKRCRKQKQSKLLGASPIGPVLQRQVGLTYFRAHKSKDFAYEGEHYEGLKSTGGTLPRTHYQHTSQNAG